MVLIVDDPGGEELAEGDGGEGRVGMFAGEVELFFGEIESAKGLAILVA